MDILKRLVKGELSLAATFWDGLVLSNVLLFWIISKLFASYATEGVLVTIILIFFIRFIIACMVISGIFFILRNKKITVWGVIVFIISVVNLIHSIYILLAFILGFSLYFF